VRDTKVPTINDPAKATAAVDVLRAVVSRPDVNTPRDVRLALSTELPKRGFSPAEVETASIELSQASVLNNMASRATEQRNVIEISRGNVDTMAARLTDSPNVATVQNLEQAAPVADAMRIAARMPDVQSGKITFQAAVARQLPAQKNFAGNANLVAREVTQGIVLNEIAVGSAALRDTTRLDTAIVSSMKNMPEKVTPGMVQDLVTDREVPTVKDQQQAAVALTALKGTMDRPDVTTTSDVRRVLKTELSKAGFKAADVEAASIELSQPRVMLAMAARVTEQKDVQALERQNTGAVATQLARSADVTTLRSSGQAAPVAAAMQSAARMPDVRSGQTTFQSAVASELKAANFTGNIDLVSREVSQARVLGDIAIGSAGLQDTARLEIASVDTMKGMTTSETRGISQDLVDDRQITTIPNETKAAAAVTALKDVMSRPSVSTARDVKIALRTELPKQGFTAQETERASVQLSQPRVLNTMASRVSGQRAVAEIGTMDAGAVAPQLVASADMSSVKALPLATQVATSMVRTAQSDDVKSGRVSFQTALSADLKAANFTGDIDQVSREASQSRVLTQLSDGAKFTPVVETLRASMSQPATIDRIAADVVKNEAIPSVTSLDRGRVVVQAAVVASGREGVKTRADFEMAMVRELGNMNFTGDAQLVSRQMSSPQVLAKVSDVARYTLAADTMRTVPQTAAPAIADELVNNPQVRSLNIQQRPQARQVADVFVKTVKENPTLTSAGDLRPVLRANLTVANIEGIDVDRVSMDVVQQPVMDRMALRVNEQKSLSDIGGSNAAALAPRLAESTDVPSVRGRQATQLARSMVRVAQRADVQSGEVPFRQALVSDLRQERFTGNAEQVSLEASQERVLTQLSEGARFTPALETLRASVSQPTTVNRIADSVVRNTDVPAVTRLGEGRVVAQAAVIASGREGVQTPADFQKAMEVELTNMNYSGDAKLVSRQMSSPQVLAKVRDVARYSQVNAVMRAAPQTATTAIADELVSNPQMRSLGTQQRPQAQEVAGVLMQTVKENPNLTSASDLRPVVRANLVKANIEGIDVDRVSMDIVQQPVMDRVASRVTEQTRLPDIGGMNADAIAPQLMASKEVSGVTDMPRATQLATSMVKSAQRADVQRGEVAFREALATDLQASNFSGNIDQVSREASQSQVLSSLSDGARFTPVVQTLRASANQPAAINLIASDVVSNNAVPAVTNVNQGTMVARAAVAVSARDDVLTPANFEMAMERELISMDYQGDAKLVSRQMSSPQVLAKVSDVARYAPVAKVMRTAPDTATPVIAREMVDNQNIPSLGPLQRRQAEDVAKVFVQTVKENPNIASTGDLRPAFRANLVKANVQGIDIDRVSTEVVQQPVMDRMASRVTEQRNLGEMRQMNTNELSTQLVRNRDVRSIESPAMARPVSEAVKKVSERPEVQERGMVAFQVELEKELVASNFPGNAQLTAREVSQPRVFSQMISTADRAQSRDSLAYRAIGSMSESELSSKLGKFVGGRAGNMAREIKSLPRSAFFSRKEFEKAAPELAKVFNDNRGLVRELADVGGIDLNADFFDFKVQGDGSIKVPVALKDGMEINFGGLEPVVLDITPASAENLPVSGT